MPYIYLGLIGLEYMKIHMFLLALFGTRISQLKVRKVWGYLSVIYLFGLD